MVRQRQHFFVWLCTRLCAREISTFFMKLFGLLIGMSTSRYRTTRAMAQKYHSRCKHVKAKYPRPPAAFLWLPLSMADPGAKRGPWLALPRALFDCSWTRPYKSTSSSLILAVSCPPQFFLVKSGQPDDLLARQRPFQPETELNCSSGQVWPLIASGR
jgi:hypothetical protein